MPALPTPGTPGLLPELYAAYGSNLWHDQMRLRCPGAEVAGMVMLPGWRLALGRFALVREDSTAFCPVGLWRVMESHLAALDVHEGRHTYARRRIVLPRPVDGATEAWIYIEIKRRPPPPGAEYVGRLRAGYRDFGLDHAPLVAALAEIGWRD